MVVRRCGCSAWVMKSQWWNWSNVTKWSAIPVPNTCILNTHKQTILPIKGCATHTVHISIQPSNNRKICTFWDWVPKKKTCCQNNGIQWTLVLGTRIPTSYKKNLAISLELKKIPPVNQDRPWGLGIASCLFPQSSNPLGSMTVWEAVYPQNPSRMDLVKLGRYTAGRYLKTIENPWYLFT